MSNKNVFDLDQNVFYMKNNRVCEAPIVSRMIVDNVREKNAYTTEQKQMWVAFGPAGVFYKTCHGILSHSECFASKPELLESL